MGKWLERLQAPVNFIANKIDEPTVVLIYHRVMKLDQDLQQLAVTPENFYDQIKHLKDNYNILTADELATCLSEKKKWPSKSVMITFDDGYADNVIHALPVLESLNVPALFYITTSKLNTRYELWWDELERIFFGGYQLPEELSITINEIELKKDISDKNKKLSAYYRLQEMLRFLAPQQIDEVITKLQLLSGAGEEGRADYRLMTYEELCKMASSNVVTIGAHTHRHPALGMLCYNRQLQEILQSKEILQSTLGKEIKHFSYPFGAKKVLGNKRYYNEDSIRACQNAGFEMVCANYYGQVHSWTNLYALPRCLVRDWDERAFRRQLKKFFSY